MSVAPSRRPVAGRLKIRDERTTQTNSMITKKAAPCARRSPREGSQTVAAVNYGDAAGLLGSNTGRTTGTAAGAGQYLAVVLTSAGRIVAIASVARAQIHGILQNKPSAGQAADVGTASDGDYRPVLGWGLCQGITRHQ